MKRPNFILLLLVLLTFGCRKDELTDSKSVLVGKWQLVEIIETTVDGLGNEKKIDINITKDYELEFLKKGRVKFYENGIVVKKKRIIFYKYSEGKLTDSVYVFCIKNRENNDNCYLVGGVNWLGDFLYTSERKKKKRTLNELLLGISSDTKITLTKYYTKMP